MTLTGNRLFPFFLLVFFLLCALLSWSFSPAARWGPAGSALSGAALCLWLLSKKDAVTVNEPRAGLRSAVATLLIVSGVAGLAGMLAMAPATYLAYMLLSKTKDRRRLLVAAAVSTLVVYLLFGVLLQVPLSRNLP